MLAVGGGVDLSAITLLCCSLFCFYNQVSRGEIVACSTRLKEKMFIVIIFKFHFFVFIYNLQPGALQVHISFG